MIFDNTPPAPVDLVAVPFPLIRAAANVNVVLSVAPVLMDGVTLGPAPDRVLLTAQTLPAENGIYELTGSGAPNGYSFDPGDPPLTHAAVAGRLYRVTCTGGCVVIGVNGVVAGPNAGGGFGGGAVPSVGFLDPGAAMFNMSTSFGQSGTVEFLSNTTLVRTPEANQAVEFRVGRAGFVMEGILNGGTWWNQSLPTTLGTDPVTFVHKVASPNALNQFPGADNTGPSGIAWTPSA